MSENVLEQQDDNTLRARKAGRPRTVHEPLHDKIHDNDMLPQLQKKDLNEAYKEYDYDRSLGFSGLNIPSNIINKFRKAGFTLSFFNISSHYAYSSSINEARNIGWVPVRLIEIPEWNNTFIPMGYSYEEKLQDYCIFADLLLMKIPVTILEAYQEKFNRMKRNDTSYVKSSQRNGHAIDRTNYGALTPLQTSLIPEARKKTRFSHDEHESDVGTYVVRDSDEFGL